MNFLRTGLVAAGVGIVLVSGVFGVSAQASKEAVIKERQEFMKAQGGDAKAVSDYAKGQGDQAAAQKAAEDLIARAPKIMALFPAGTSTTEFPDKTKAKPELFTETDKVKAMITAMQADQTKLLEAVKAGNAAGAGEQLGAMNKDGCGACHGAYRTKSS